MQRKSSSKALLTIASCAVVAGAAGAQERSMGVTQGPEAVFGRPAAEVLPMLEGATPTGENGRVGGELVFWGYRLADGRDVFFFACAMVGEVDCPRRVESICPTGTTVLDTAEGSGKVVHRQCRDIAVAHPGDTRPGCVDTDVDSGLTIGLVACN